MATLVATPDPATGTVRIDVDQSIAHDLFNRVVANAWGSPTVGPAWITSGGLAANYSVNGTQGIHSHTSTGVDRTSQMNVNVTDFDMLVAVAVEALPTGAGYQQTLIGRLSGTDLVALTILGQPTGEVFLILEFSDGVASMATDPVQVPDITSDDFMMYRFRACGMMLYAKGWRADMPEVTDWTLDFSIPRVFGGAVQINSFLIPGNTNPLPYDFSYETFALNTGNPLHLYRVTPDGVRTEVIGSPFNTAPLWPDVPPNDAVMWDSTAPFDTEIYYEVTSDCSPDTLITSNTVTLDSDGDGWLRDPLDPTLNLRIVMDAFFDDCVDEDVIVFSGLDAREYENASGIFDHINAQRPITVSMTRKNYGSALTLTSFSLDDVDSLEDIFQSGRILSLSLPVEYGWAHRTFGTDFITCFDITQSLFNVDQRVSTRIWTVPFRLSPEPADTIEDGVGGNGIGGGGATYDDLAASALGATYTSLSGSGNTYLQTAQGVGY